ncbi:DUF6313 family protein [Streptosporangium sp. NPDC002544]|uniref:DUF6313 family protein n=1 Tax=Streptosporangium sp. NPDC002544 TaxID=3154538 RepID=UPI003317CF2C
MMSAPPPQMPLRARCRRRLRSLAALSKTRYWLLTRAIWLALAFFLIFAIDAVLIGWSTAYEVMIGIKSPAEVSAPVVSWAVSLIGWLMIPAFVGGTAGYLVTRQIDARRTQSEADVAQALRRRAQPPSSRRGGKR